MLDLFSTDGSLDFSNAGAPKCVRPETVQDLEAILTKLAILEGKSIVEYIEDLKDEINSEKTTVEEKIKNLENKLYLITELDDNGSESLAESIKQIKKLLSTDLSSFNCLINDLKDLKTESEQNFQKINQKIININTKVHTLDETQNHLIQKVQDIESQLDNCCSSGNSGGSGGEVDPSIIAKAVKDLKQEIYSELDSAKLNFNNISLAKIINAFRSELRQRPFTDSEIDGIAL